jgi:hypothetical protein
MACCEDKIYKRKKNLIHVSILACQYANITPADVAVIRKVHGVYGQYYDFIDYAAAKKQGFKVLRRFRQGDTI